MMDVKARQRFSEVLAVGFGIALLGFLGYLVLSQRAASPNVPSVAISSNGSIVAVGSKKSAAGAKQPSQHTTPTTYAPSVTTSTDNPGGSSGAVNTGQKQGNSMSQYSGTGGSLVSKTATIACGTPLKPVLATVSNVEEGLHSLLPLAKAVSIKASCSS